MLKVWAMMVLGTSLAVAQAPPPDLATAPPPEITKRCWDLLNDALQDKNPDVRKDAAESLSLVPVNRKTLQQLNSMLNDRDVAVRVAVVTTVAEFKDKRAVPLLKKALADPVPEVDFAAAKALYQLHDPEGEKFLLEVIDGESKASSSYLSKEERNTVHILHTPDKLVMFAAIQAVGFVPVPGVGFGISSAHGILSNPGASARASALLLIAHSRDPALEEAVKSALSAKEWSERAAAAHVVATHPFPALGQKLLPLLDDKKSAVRLRAAAAYIRLRYPSPGPRAPSPHSRALESSESH